MSLNDLSTSTASTSGSASGSASSTLLSAAVQGESRSQVEPLPSKRQPTDIESGQLGGSLNTNGSSTVTLNDGPHPAENRSNNNTNVFDAATIPRPTYSHDPSLATIRPSKYAVLLTLRSPRPNPRLGGLAAPTAVRISLILVTIGGTILGWLLSYKSLRSATTSPQGGEPPSREMATTSSIFLHIAFGSACLILLFLLRRAIFQARDERYSWKHPGQIHPRLRGRAPRHHEQNESISRLAPWNRPPLPSYAHALGHRGTGDVEDDAIARPPPPAYGNTRGSTLLLSGVRLFRSDSRRSRATSPTSERRSESRRVSDSMASVRSGNGTGRRAADTPERDVDLEAGVIAEIRRARKLEETLAKLEDDARNTISLPQRPRPVADPSSGHSSSRL